jgi:hypothetical protein
MDRSVAGYDIPQILSLSWVYELPIGKGKALNLQNGILDEALGNWNLSGIFTGRSGQPFNTNASGDIPNTGNVVERGNRTTGGCSPYTASKGRSYLNTTCFTTPAPFTFGNEGRNDLRSPGVTNLDLSLVKTFKLWEGGRRLEFRTDFFNSLNQSALGVPDTTLTDSNFGQITSTAQTEREIQFALKVYF